MLKLLLPVMVLGGLGAAFGALLGVAAKFFKVQIDKKAEKINALLPGANCGGCGFAGCGAMAEALVNGRADISLCAAIKEENARSIASILGQKMTQTERKVAHVFCGGTCDKTMQKCNYDGLQDCLAAQLCGGGEKSCSYGCMGYGSCAEACHFDAITIQDGVAKVHKEKCTGCGACVKACPRQLIELVPAVQKAFVDCRSHDKGVAMKELCKVGCIGCGICAKNCPENMILITDNLATIGYGLCTNCGQCAEACPKHAITFI